MRLEWHIEKLLEKVDSVRVVRSERGQPEAWQFEIEGQWYSVHYDNVRDGMLNKSTVTPKYLLYCYREAERKKQEAQSESGT